ncbi:MAG: putative heme iron utilization protein [Gammaproteobacteria bacterium]|jgi:putative heme iron utilization protein
MLSNDDAAGIIAHMNADHADAVLAYAHAYTSEHACTCARLVAIDANTLTLVALHKGRQTRVSINLPESIDNGQAARRVLIQMVKQAREAISAREQA